MKPRAAKKAAPSVSQRLASRLDEAQRILFKLDSTNDGTVSPYQLALGLNKLHVGLSPAEVAKLVSSTKLSNDGRIQYESFLAGVAHEAEASKPTVKRSSPFANPPQPVPTPQKVHIDQEASDRVNRYREIRRRARLDQAKKAIEEAKKTQKQYQPLDMDQDEAAARAEFESKALRQGLQASPPLDHDGGKGLRPMVYTSKRMHELSPRYGKEHVLTGPIDYRAAPGSKAPPRELQSHFKTAAVELKPEVEKQEKIFNEYSTRRKFKPQRSGGDPNQGAAKLQLDVSDGRNPITGAKPEIDPIVDKCKTQVLAKLYGNPNRIITAAAAVTSSSSMDAHLTPGQLRSVLVERVGAQVQEAEVEALYSAIAEDRSSVTVASLKSFLEPDHAVRAAKDQNHKDWFGGVKKSNVDVAKDAKFTSRVVLADAAQPLDDRQRIGARKAATEIRTKARSGGAVDTLIVKLKDQFKKVEKTPGIVGEDSFRRILKSAGVHASESEVDRFLSLFKEKDKGYSYTNFLVSLGGEIDQVNSQRTGKRVNREKNVSRLGAEKTKARRRTNYMMTTEEKQFAEVQDKIVDMLKGRSKDLYKVFELFDDSGDGSIDVDEFRIGLKSLGVDLNDKQFDILKRKVDADGNGEIDFPEFAGSFGFVDTAEAGEGIGRKRLGVGAFGLSKSMARLLPDTAVKELTPEQHRLLDIRNRLAAMLESRSRDLRRTFRQFDRDHDGSVSVDELKTGLGSLNIVLPDDDLSFLLKKIDADGSGEIEYDEFAAMIRDPEPIDPSAWKMASGKRKIKTGHFDKSDGYTVVMKGGQKVTVTKEMRKLNQIREKIIAGLESKSHTMHKVFREFDEDKDGTVSLDEFERGLANMNINLSKKEFDFLAGVIDADKSGTIDYAEFSAQLRDRDVMWETHAEALNASGKKKYGEGLFAKSSDMHVLGDRDKKLTEEEQKSLQLRRRVIQKLEQKSGNLLRAFRAMDEDKNGSVDHDEFRRGVGNLGVDLTKEEVEELIKIADVDNDGDIDYVEFSAALKEQDKNEEVDPASLIHGKARADQGQSVEVTGKGTLVKEDKITKRLNSVKKQIHDKLSTKYKDSMRKVFRTFDLDLDGTVTADEFRTGLERVGVVINSNDFDLLVKDLDKDGSGDIDYTEFANEMKQTDVAFAQQVESRDGHVGAGHKTSDGMAGVKGEQKPRDRQMDRITSLVGDKIHQKSSKLQQVFRTFDSDGNGTLDMEELKAGLQSIGVNLNEKDFARLVQEVDEDKSGDVDFKEFASHMLPSGLAVDIATVAGKEEESAFHTAGLRPNNNFVLSPAPFKSPDKQDQGRREAVEKKFGAYANRVVDTVESEVARKTEGNAVRIRNALRRLDSDGDGFVTHEELRHGLGKLDVNVNNIVLNALAIRHDPENSGVIRIADFADDMAGRYSDKVSSATQQARKKVLQRIHAKPYATRGDVRYHRAAPRVSAVTPQAPKSPMHIFPTDQQLRTASPQAMVDVSSLPKRSKSVGPRVQHYDDREIIGHYDSPHRVYRRVHNKERTSVESNDDYLGTRGDPDSPAPIVRPRPIKKRVGPRDAKGPKVPVKTKDTQAGIAREIMNSVRGHPDKALDALKRFDTYKSGRINQREFVEGLRNAGVFLSSQKVEQMMRRLDPQGSNHIDYQKATDQIREDNAAVSPPKRAELRVSDSEYFAIRERGGGQQKSAGVAAVLSGRAPMHSGFADHWRSKRRLDSPEKGVDADSARRAKSTPRSVRYDSGDIIAHRKSTEEVSDELFTGRKLHSDGSSRRIYHPSSVDAMHNHGDVIAHRDAQQSRGKGAWTDQIAATSHSGLRKEGVARLSRRKIDPKTKGTLALATSKHEKQYSGPVDSFSELMRRKATKTVSSKPSKVRVGAEPVFPSAGRMAVHARSFIASSPRRGHPSSGDIIAWRE